ncbi:cytochrome P450 [Kitasatospora phosalacinea]|uniref:cytochrome P450 n=1 Tax=Kitasatospora phosalacinea TaxID=2065 RepID=UPI003651CE8F
MLDSLKCLTLRRMRRRRRLTRLVERGIAAGRGPAALPGGIRRREAAYYLQNAFFSTGVGQLSEAMTHLLLLLAHHPEAQQRIRREGPDGGHLDRVLAESLRMYPLFGVAQRITSADIQLDDGRRLPRGTVLCFDYPAYHRSGFRDPDAFDPDRWLDLPPTAPGYAPFGVPGNRPGPARAAATAATWALAWEFVRRYDLHSSAGHLRSLPNKGPCLILPHPACGPVPPAPVAELAAMRRRDRTEDVTRSFRQLFFTAWSLAMARLLRPSTRYFRTHPHPCPEETRAATHDPRDRPPRPDQGRRGRSRRGGPGPAGPGRGRRPAGTGRGGGRAGAQRREPVLPGRVRRVRRCRERRPDVHHRQLQLPARHRPGLAEGDHPVLRQSQRAAHRPRRDRELLAPQQRPRHPVRPEGRLPRVPANSATTVAISFGLVPGAPNYAPSGRWIFTTDAENTVDVDTDLTRNCTVFQFLRESLDHPPAGNANLYYLAPQTALVPGGSPAAVPFAFHNGATGRPGGTANPAHFTFSTPFYTRVPATGRPAGLTPLFEDDDPAVPSVYRLPLPAGLGASGSGAPLVVPIPLQSQQGAPRNLAYGYGIVLPTGTDTQNDLSTAHHSFEVLHVAPDAV